MFYFLTEFHTDFHLVIYFLGYHHVGHNIIVKPAEVCLIVGYLRERNAGRYLLLCVPECTLDGWVMNGSGRLCSFIPLLACPPSFASLLELPSIHVSL